MNEENTNIVPGTPETPVTPDAMTTPVVTETEEAVLDAPVEQNIDNNVEETPSTPAPEVSAEAAPEVVINNTDTTPIVETPIEVASDMGEVEPTPSVTNENTSITAELNIQQIDQSVVEPTKEKKKMPIVAIIIIIVGVLGILGFAGTYILDNYRQADDDEPIVEEPLPDDGEEASVLTKEFKLMIGSEEHNVKHSFTTTDLGEVDVDADIPEGTKIKAQKVEYALYLDSNEIYTNEFTIYGETVDINKYIELFDDSYVSSIKDVETDTYYLVASYLETDGLGLDKYPTIFTLDGKKLATLKTSFRVGGGAYVEDANSKFYVDFNAFGPKGCFYVDDTSIHYIKDVTTIGEEWKVFVKSGVVTNEKVADIQITGVQTKYEPELIIEG